MKLITRQALANEAHVRWKRQFPKRDDDVTRKIAALGASPVPDEVDAVIGNGAWTRLYSCSECEREECVVVEIGQPSDYDSNTAWICLDCLKAALALFEEGGMA